MPDPPSFGCELCAIPRMSSATQLAAHEAGRRHARRMRNVAIDDAQTAFDDLPRLNAWLDGLGMGQEASLAAARRVLKLTFVNIFDLLAERYLVHPTLAALSSYSVKENKIFPLDRAKSEGLRCFLQPLLRGGRRRGAGGGLSM